MPRGVANVLHRKTERQHGERSQKNACQFSALSQRLTSGIQVILTTSLTFKNHLLKILATS